MIQFTRDCAECGRTFAPAHSSTLTCSPTCRKKRLNAQARAYYHRTKQQVDTWKRDCWYCGRTFTAKHRNARMCSEACQLEQRRARQRAYRAAVRAGKRLPVTPRGHPSITQERRVGRPWPDVIRSMANEDVRLAALFLDALNSHRARRGLPPVKAP